MVPLRSVCLVVAFLAGAAASQAQTQEPGSVLEAQAPPASAPAAIQPPRGPVRISAGVVASLKLSGDNPVYPPEAKAQGVQGAVVLHAIIGQDGQIQSLQLVSGNAELSKAAWDAVKTWVYKPYLLNGEPTAVDTTITVNFQLEGSVLPPSA